MKLSDEEQVLVDLVINRLSSNRDLRAVIMTIADSRSSEILEDYSVKNGHVNK